MKPLFVGAYEVANAVSQLKISIIAEESSDQEGTLHFPVIIPAHGAISGCIQLNLPAAMLEKRQIEGYRLHLKDPHGETIELIPIIL